MSEERTEKRVGVVVMVIKGSAGREPGYWYIPGADLSQT